MACSGVPKDLISAKHMLQAFGLEIHTTQHICIIKDHHIIYVFEWSRGNTHLSCVHMRRNDKKTQNGYGHLHFDDSMAACVFCNIISTDYHYNQIVSDLFWSRYVAPRSKYMACQCVIRHWVIVTQTCYNLLGKIRPKTCQFPTKPSG